MPETTLLPWWSALALLAALSALTAATVMSACARPFAALVDRHYLDGS